CSECTRNRKKERCTGTVGSIFVVRKDPAVHVAGIDDDGSRRIERATRLVRCECAFLWRREIRARDKQPDDARADVRTKPRHGALGEVVRALGKATRGPVPVES